MRLQLCIYRARKLCSSSVSLCKVVTLSVVLRPPRFRPLRSAHLANRCTFLLFTGVLEDPHPTELAVEPLSTKSEPTPDSNDHHPVPLDEQVCHLSLQLFLNEGSEAVSPCALEYQEHAFRRNQRILHQAIYQVEKNGHGRCLLGYFKCSQPLYKVYSDLRSPAASDNDSTSYINHISARLLLPDSNRREMPTLAPELLEEIFLLSVERQVLKPRH